MVRFQFSRRSLKNECLGYGECFISMAWREIWSRNRYLGHNAYQRHVLVDGATRIVPADGRGRGYSNHNCDRGATGVSVCAGIAAYAQPRDNTDYCSQGSSPRAAGPVQLN